MYEAGKLPCSVRPSHTPGTGLAADLIHSLHLAFGPGAATESLEGDYVESRVNSTVYRWDSSTKGTLIDPNIDLLFYSIQITFIQRVS